MTKIKWTPYLATAYAEGFCEGEDATEKEQIEAWQYLIDTGLCWKLQGFFGRTASALIDDGVCKPAKKGGDKGDVSPYEKYAGKDPKCDECGSTGKVSNTFIGSILCKKCEEKEIEKSEQAYQNSCFDVDRRESELAEEEGPDLK